MAQWIALGITVAGLVISGAVLWGAMNERMKSTEKDILKLFAQSKEHFEHAQNEDAHWTKRERDDHKQKLDEIYQEVKNLAARIYGDKNNHGH